MHTDLGNGVLSCENGEFVLEAYSALIFSMEEYFSYRTLNQQWNFRWFEFDGDFPCKAGQISDEIGFSNQFHFSRVFREQPYNGLVNLYFYVLRVSRIDLSPLLCYNISIMHRRGSFLWAIRAEKRIFVWDCLPM